MAKSPTFTGDLLDDLFNDPTGPLVRAVRAADERKNTYQDPHGPINQSAYEQFQRSVAQSQERAWPETYRSLDIQGYSPRGVVSGTIGTQSAVISNRAINPIPQMGASPALEHLPRSRRTPRWLRQQEKFWQRRRTEQWEAIIRRSQPRTQIAIPSLGPSRANTGRTQADLARRAAERQEAMRKWLRQTSREERLAKRQARIDKRLKTRGEQVFIDDQLSIFPQTIEERNRSVTAANAKRYEESVLEYHTTVKANRPASSQLSIFDWRPPVEPITQPIARVSNFGRFTARLARMPKWQTLGGTVGLAGLAGFTVASLALSNRFSGYDDAYNSIEGMSESGTAASRRKSHTDFGSGYKGPHFGSMFGFKSVMQYIRNPIKSIWGREARIAGHATSADISRLKQLTGLDTSIPVFQQDNILTQKRGAAFVYNDIKDMSGRVQIRRGIHLPSQSTLSLAAHEMGHATGFQGALRLSGQVPKALYQLAGLGTMLGLAIPGRYDPQTDETGPGAVHYGMSGLAGALASVQLFEELRASKRGLQAIRAMGGKMVPAAASLGAAFSTYLMGATVAMAQPLLWYQVGEWSWSGRNAKKTYFKQKEKEKHNTITGMSEQGLAAKMRKKGTDFGSGYRGPRGDYVSIVHATQFDYLPDIQKYGLMASPPEDKRQWELSTKDKETYYTQPGQIRRSRAVYGAIEGMPQKVEIYDPNQEFWGEAKLRFKLKSNEPYARVARPVEDFFFNTVKKSVASQKPINEFMRDPYKSHEVLVGRDVSAKDIELEFHGGGRRNITWGTAFGLGAAAAAVAGHRGLALGSGAIGGALMLANIPRYGSLASRREDVRRMPLTEYKPGMEKDIPFSLSEFSRGVHTGVRWALIGSGLAAVSQTREEILQKAFGQRLGRFLPKLTGPLWYSEQALDIFEAKDTKTRVREAGQFGVSWGAYELISRGMERHIMPRLAPAFEQIPHKGLPGLAKSLVSLGLAGYAGRAFSRSYDNLFSGKDDAYNTIHGLGEQGLAAKMRKDTTEFGSGWQGIKSYLERVEESVESYHERLMYKLDSLRDKYQYEEEQTRRKIREYKTALTTVKYMGFMLAAPAYIIADKITPKEAMVKKYGRIRGRVVSAMPATAYFGLHTLGLLTGEETPAGLAAQMGGWATVSFGLKYPLEKFGKHIGHLGFAKLIRSGLGLAGSVAAKSIYNRFAGKGEAYNTIEGMKEGGTAAELRKLNTDFGSGWQGILSRGAKTASVLFKENVKEVSHIVKHNLIPGTLKMRPLETAVVGFNLFEIGSLAYHAQKGDLSLGDVVTTGMSLGLSKYAYLGIKHRRNIASLVRYGMQDTGKAKVLAAGLFQTLKGQVGGYVKHGRPNAFAAYVESGGGRQGIEAAAQRGFATMSQAAKNRDMNVTDLFRGIDTSFLNEIIDVSKSNFGSAYNTIPGMSEKGYASVLRKLFTDFGSPSKMKAGKSVANKMIPLFRGTREEVLIHEGRQLRLGEENLGHPVEQWLEQFREILYPDRPSRLSSTWWASDQRWAEVFLGTSTTTRRGFMSEIHRPMGEVFVTSDTIYMRTRGYYEMISNQAGGLVPAPRSKNPFKEGTDLFDDWNYLIESAHTYWTGLTPKEWAAHNKEVAAFYKKYPDYHHDPTAGFGMKEVKMDRPHDLEILIPGKTEAEKIRKFLGPNEYTVKEWGLPTIPVEPFRNSGIRSTRELPETNLPTLPKLVELFEGRIRAWTRANPGKPVPQNENFIDPRTGTYPDVLPIPQENAAMNPQPSALHPKGELSEGKPNEGEKIIKALTFFGSKWDRLRSISSLLGKTYDEVLASKAFHKALAGGSVESVIASGRFGRTELMKTMLEGHELYYVRKTLDPKARGGIVHEIQQRFGSEIQEVTARMRSHQDALHSMVSEQPLLSELGTKLDSRDLLARGVDNALLMRYESSHRLFTEAQAQLVEKRKAAIQLMKAYAPGLDLGHEAGIMRHLGKDDILPTAYRASKTELFMEAAGVYDEGTKRFRLAEQLTEFGPDRPLPQSVMKQIEQRVQENFRQGIMNMDVRAPNVLYDEQSGRLWSIDYGIAYKIRQGASRTRIQSDMFNLERNLNQMRSGLFGTTPFQSAMSLTLNPPSRQTPDLIDATIETVSVAPPRSVGVATNVATPRRVGGTPTVAGKPISHRSQTQIAMAKTVLANTQKQTQADLWRRATTAGRNHNNTYARRMRRSRGDFRD